MLAMSGSNYNAGDAIKNEYQRVQCTFGGGGIFVLLGITFQCFAEFFHTNVLHNTNHDAQMPQIYMLFRSYEEFSLVLA